MPDSHTYFSTLLNETNVKKYKNLNSLLLFLFDLLERTHFVNQLLPL